MTSGTEQLVKESPVSLLRKKTAPEQASSFSNQRRLEVDKLLESSLQSSKVDEILSKREREVFDLVIAGHTNKEIAQKLYRSERTVEYHRNRMMQKLGTRNPVELVKCAITMGLI